MNLLQTCRFLTIPGRVFKLVDEWALWRLQSQAELNKAFEFGRKCRKVHIKSALNLLPESFSVFLDEPKIVFVLMGGLLEWGLPRDHIKEDDARGEDIGFTGLVRHFKVDFRAHVINCANECFGLFPQRRSENKICDLQIKVISSVDKQILWLQVPMCHLRPMNLSQSLHQLFEIVAGDMLVKTSGLWQNHEQICLIRGKDKVCALVSLKTDLSNIVAGDDVRVTDRVENLSLVGSFVDFRLLLFVKFDEDFDWCSRTLNTSRRVLDKLWFHQTSKALKIPPLWPGF